MLKFTEYRKATNVYSYIHCYYNHETRAKRSAFLTMFLRAYRMRSLEFLDEEIRKIFDIAKKKIYVILRIT